MKKRNLTDDQIQYFKENWESKNCREWCKYFGLSKTVLDRTIKDLGIRFILRKKIVSDETKKQISKKRKEWLQNNPDQHPWRNRDKFKSKPCEKAREFLDSLGIKYIPEFQPEIAGRFFSIDIALPDKMIALEINGNQHYERDGQLKPYYQERHDLLVSAGWNVFEIHYSACFNLEKWAEFVETLRNSEIVKEFDYFTYTPRNIKKLICDCGKKISRSSSLCGKCAAKKLGLKRRIERPTKDELLKLIWTIPMSILCKSYKLSDKAIKKWANDYNIPTPPRGYWIKFKSGHLTNCKEIRESLFKDYNLMVSAEEFESPFSVPATDKELEAPLDYTDIIV